MVNVTEKLDSGYIPLDVKTYRRNRIFKKIRRTTFRFVISQIESRIFVRETKIEGRIFIFLFFFFFFFREINTRRDPKLD